MKKRLQGIAILVAIFCIALNSAYGVLLTDYTINEQGTTFTPVTGTDIGTAGADDQTYQIPLPFNFEYHNQTFTSGSNISACTNGWLSLTYTTSANLGLQITSQPNTIAWNATDLVIQVPMTYTTIGTQPNRVLVVQWLNVRYFGSTGQNMNCQIRLYETSGQIEVIFGVMAGVGDNGRQGLFAFMGNPQATYYINVQPGNPSTFYYSNVNPNTSLWMNATYGPNAANKKYTLSSYPSLSALYPAQNAVLQLGNVYDAAPHKPGIEVLNFNNRTDVYVKYKIVGPISQSNPPAIYTAHVVGNANNEAVPVTSATMRFSAAKGIGANSNPNNGALNLTNPSLIGGKYKIVANLELRNTPTSPPFYTGPTIEQEFNIALQNDLELSSIISPKSKDVTKYPLNLPIQVQIKVMNVGVNPVTAFRAIAKLYHAGNVIRTDTVTYTNVYMQTGESMVINFPNFNPPGVSEYSMTASVELISAADMYLPNNIMPRAGDTLIFATAYPIEPQADRVVAPVGSINIGRPVIPIGRFSNNGMEIIPEANVRFCIQRLFGDFDTVYRSSTIAYDIPAGRFNFVMVSFPDVWVPTQGGLYKAHIWIYCLDDPVATNNYKDTTFIVSGALEGTYTIGTLFASDTLRNFLTFESAMDALYLKGVSGPVIFELTDSLYNVGSVSVVDKPALDMSSLIVGVNAQNTITFRPHASRSSERGSILINLRTGNGIGILLGQNAYPANANASVNLVTPNLKREYANPPQGLSYIIFDGGANKSLKFTLQTTSNFRAVFYLDNGASAVAIKNCLIEDGINQSVSNHIRIPMTWYNTAQSSFQFDKDLRDDGSTYSAGIVLRSKAPLDSKTGANLNNLDTLQNKYNVIEGNEISGFGYGVVSLGIGVLYNQGEGRYKRYYNLANTIKDNIIYNVRRAGIFVGYEEGTVIKNNRIYNVTAPTAASEAAGIIAGGSGRGDTIITTRNLYNNIGLVIDGNEISGITSSTNVYGIKVEQARNSFPFTDPPFVHFPDVAEQTTIINNVVWGFNVQNRNGSRWGIRLFTERTDLYPTNWLQTLWYPRVYGYFTRNDKIGNNTIIIGDDAHTNGVTAGITIQSAWGTQLYNNAIAIHKNTIATVTPVNSAIFYEGLKPGVAGALISDRNAFELAPNASVMRFVETDASDAIIEGGTTAERDDYKQLTQWQMWTKQDLNSVVCIFTNNLTYQGTPPAQKLRLVSNPALGLMLSNRGERLSWVSTDIDGNQRGTAGQRYDIGAFEYEGAMFVSAAEALVITEPGAYRAGSGSFSDAEYIMTTKPIRIKAMFRNAGNLPLSGVRVTVRAYRQLPDGTFDTTAEYENVKYANIASTEAVEVAFDNNFNPRTYSEFVDDEGNLLYNVPQLYRSMITNVTPVYKLVASIDSDVSTTQNTVSKEVRFYIKRSLLDLLLSMESVGLDLTGVTNQDVIAGKLNADTLLAGLGRFGWSVNQENADLSAFDIFDRLSWEPKSVNYNMYRTIFWGDGNDKALTRYQRINIVDYLSSGSFGEKKNFVVGSQEMLRQNIDIDRDLVTLLLRADTTQTVIVSGGTNYVRVLPNPKSTVSGNNFVLNVSNDNNRAIGIEVGKDLVEVIKATQFTGDAPPYCAAMKVSPLGEGLARSAYKYRQYYVPPSGNLKKPDSTMGVATTTFTRNVVYLGVDWRHFAKIESVLRSVIDFIEKNGGIVVAVELIEFTGELRNGKVELYWATASEQESDRFELEKRERGGNYRKIAEVKAVGRSLVRTDYGPVVDGDIQAGKRYEYRLKMVDRDGSYKYSNVVEIEYPLGSLWLGELQPNPAESVAKIEYNLPELKEVEFIIYDESGRIVRRDKPTDVKRGLNVYEIELSGLSSGVYQVVMQSGGQFYTRTLSVVK